MHRCCVKRNGTLPAANRQIQVQNILLFEDVGKLLGRLVHKGDDHVMKFRFYTEFIVELGYGEPGFNLHNISALNAL